MNRGWDMPRLVGRRGLQIGLGVTWAFDGLLQAEGPKFSYRYPQGTLAQSVMGAPGWVNQSVFAGIHPFQSHWPYWNLAAVLLQLALGALLVSGRCTRLALGVSVGWALAVWWLGESFGMLPSGFALMEGGAPGSALLYAILGVLAWPRRGRPDIDRRSWIAVWSVLWIGAALLHLPFVYSSRRVYEATMSMTIQGSPRYLADIGDGFARLSSQHTAMVVAVSGILEFAVGLSWHFNPERQRRWLGLGIGMSLIWWIAVQQLGGIFTSAATDPNLGPMMVLLALVAWPRLGSNRVKQGDGQSDDSRYRHVDGYESTSRVAHG